MKPILFFESAWLGIKGFFSRLFSPFIVQCATCKKLLHAPKGAKEISHGLCWLCYYKQLGGTFPKLPKLTDFQMYLTLFKKHKVVHDEVWIGQTLYEGLKKNGRIQREAKNQGRPLSNDERHIIDNVHKVAAQFGYKQDSINAAEMEGAGYFPYGGNQ